MAFELALHDQRRRLLGAPGRLRAYGRGDCLRGHDLEAPPCELLPHFCRQDIRDGDAPRTVRRGMQKGGAFDQQWVAVRLLGGSTAIV
jgi:hypothetical protein